MRSRKAALGFVLLLLLIDVFGLGLVVPVLPKLVESFAGGGRQGAFAVGALAAVYAVMQFLFAPILGSLSDRFGRRPVLLLSLFGTGLDYVLLTFAPSLGWFFVGRVISGLCGASYSAAMAFIADVTPPEKRAQSFGLVGMAFGVGFILGPLSSAFLSRIDLPIPDVLAGLVGMTVLAGVRVPFLFAALVTLLNALYGLFVLPESLSVEHRRPFTLGRANAFGTLLEIVRHPLVGRLVVVLFLMGAGQRILESTWVLYGSHRYGWSTTETGLSLAVVGVAVALVQGGLVRVLIPSLGERTTLTAGLLAMAAGFVLYGLNPYGPAMYAIIPIASLGYVSGPAAQGLMSKSMPANEQGLLQGGVASVTSVTSIVGPLVGTSLFGLFSSPEAPISIPGISFFAGAGLFLAALAMARVAFRRLPAPEASQA